MKRDFCQRRWNEELENDLNDLIERALWEDAREVGDLTSLALIDANAEGAARVNARQSGVIAGLAGAALILRKVDPRLKWNGYIQDGEHIIAGTELGEIRGPVRTMLTAERLLLNFVGKLSGIATMTAYFVELIQGTSAHIYDTRKTTLGWRNFEKYAVHCGGGRNHRTGLFDAILIKDNHLGFGQEHLSDSGFSSNVSFSKNVQISENVSLSENVQLSNKIPFSNGKSEPERRRQNGTGFSPAEAVRLARLYVQTRFDPTDQLGFLSSGDHFSDVICRSNILNDSNNQNNSNILNNSNNVDNLNNSDNLNNIDNSNNFDISSNLNISDSFEKKDKLPSTDQKSADKTSFYSFNRSGFPDSPMLPMIEIEVDTLEQLAEVLPEHPDVIMLDNMKPDMLRKAVAMRRFFIRCQTENRNFPSFSEMISDNFSFLSDNFPSDEKTGTIIEEVFPEFEASGGINAETVRAVAETGVERISIGALTHSVKTLDIGLDWI